MDLITDLLITVLLYCTPAVFYRYAIAEAPIPGKKATKFSILCSVIVYVALFAIYMAIGADAIPNMAAAFIWGTVNTWILTRGSKKTVNAQENVPPTFSNASGTANNRHSANSELKDDETSVLPQPDPRRFAASDEPYASFYNELFDGCHGVLKGLAPDYQLRLELHAFLFICHLHASTDRLADAYLPCEEITAAICDCYPPEQMDDILEFLDDAIAEYDPVYHGATNIDVRWLESINPPQEVLDNLTSEPLGRMSLFFWSKLMNLIKNSKFTESQKRQCCMNVMSLYVRFFHDFFLWMTYFEALLVESSVGECLDEYHNDDPDDNSDDNLDENEDEDEEDNEFTSGTSFRPYKTPGELFDFLFYYITHSVQGIKTKGNVSEETLAFLYFAFDYMTFKSGKNREAVWGEISDFIKKNFPKSDLERIHQKLDDRAVLYAHITNHQIMPNNGYYPPFRDERANSHPFYRAWFAFGGILKDPSSAKCLLDSKVPLRIRPMDEVIDFSTRWTFDFLAVIGEIHKSGLFYTD